jgi:hypothetical protein
MTSATWENRDLPVLNAIVEQWDQGVEPVVPGAIVNQTGLSESVVQRSLRALAREEPPLFVPIYGSSMAGSSIAGATDPTGHARRAVGAWPTPESIADRLVQALAEAADREPDDERRGWLKKTATYLGTAGRDIAVEVAASALARSTGAG